MAKRASDPSSRIRILEESLAKAKKLKRGTTLTSIPTAELLSVSWPILRQWTRDFDGFAESGAFVAGGNGIEWQFKPVATVEFLLGHFKAKKESQASRTRKVRQIVTGGNGDGADGDDGLGDLDIDELQKLLSATTRYIDVRERAHELVDRNKMLGILRPLLTDMIQAGLRSVHELDPNGRWSKSERAIAEMVAQTILTKQERIAQDGVNRLGGAA